MKKTPQNYQYYQVCSCLFMVEKTAIFSNDCYSHKDHHRFSSIIIAKVGNKMAFIKGISKS